MVGSVRIGKKRDAYLHGRIKISGFRYRTLKQKPYGVDGGRPQKLNNSRWKKISIFFQKSVSLVDDFPGIMLNGETEGVRLWPDVIFAFDVGMKFICKIQIVGLIARKKSQISLLVDVLENERSNLKNSTIEKSNFFFLFFQFRSREVKSFK